MLDTNIQKSFYSSSSIDLSGCVCIHAIVSKQGSRITYQTNLKFRQITYFFDYTDVKPPTENGNMDNIDISTLRNRYLRLDKVKDIVDYISKNLDSYLLPPLSAVTPNFIPFIAFNDAEIKRIMGKEYDLVENPHLIGTVLEEFNGILQGLLIIKESDFNVEILDGNHRVASIHQLLTMGKEFKNLRIAVQIFVENDVNRQRQAFVDMNTSTPIDKTILTLFSHRDPLAIAAKQTIGDNPNYFITEFISASPDYIGFDAVNDAITRNSQAILSLNMVKNMLVRFSVGDSGTPKKFNTLVTNCSKREYDKLLMDFQLYMKAVFNNIEPFNLIKQQGTSSIPSLREEYISLTGAGLYIIATIGHLARNKNIDLEATAKRLAELDWKRERRDDFSLRRVNPLFTTGILNHVGNISNTRNAIKATVDSISEILDL